MKHFAMAMTFVMCMVAGIQPAVGSIRSKAVREVVEAVGKALERSGIRSGEYAMKDAAENTVQRLSKTYGRKALEAISDGGIELVEGTAEYGDDVIKYAMEASPGARRALAGNLPEMLPLVRRVGVDAVELEARAPGMAEKVFNLFGDKAGVIIARDVASEDIPRLVAYAEKADTPATRGILVETYKKEGKDFFKRIPPSLVLTAGLTSAMLLGTHEMTAPFREAGKSIAKHKDIASNVAMLAVKCSFVIVFLVILLLLWRFRLLPWHGRRKYGLKQDVSGRMYPGGRRENKGRPGPISL